MQVFILDQIFVSPSLFDVLSQIGIFHCRFHVDKFIGYHHVLLIYWPLLIPFLTQTSCVDNISHPFLGFAPFRMVLIFPVVHFDKLPDDVLILL